MSYSEFAGLPEPTQALLMELVGVKVQVDWEKVGLGLGLEQSTLNTIRVNCSDSYSCMSRVFEKWYNSSSSEYTWKKLAEVLCSTTVNRQGFFPDLLRNIQSELLESYL